MSSLTFTHFDDTYFSVFIYSTSTMKAISLTLLCFCYFGGISECGSGPNEKRLLHHLLDKYQTLERPVRPNDTLNVSISAKLLSIVYVNRDCQQIGANFFMTYEWQDVNLQWNPMEFGNVINTHPSSQRVWTPSIHLFKEATGNFPNGFLDKNVVRFDGRVTHKHSIKLEVACEISSIDFPYDEHECVFEFSSWIYPPELVSLTTSQESVDLSDYTTSPSFDLLEVPVKVIQDQHKSSVSFTLRIRRNGDFPLKMFQIYTTLISSMIILSCLMSPETPHKLTIGVFGILISLFASYDVVTDASSYSHNNIPVRIVSFFTNLLLLSVSVLMSNLFVTYLYNLHTSMPLLLKDKVIQLHQFHGCFKSIPGFSTFISPQVADKTCSTENCTNNSEWKLLSLIIDRLLFPVWTFVVIFFCFFCFPNFKVS